MAGNHLDDDRWHTVHVRRRAYEVEVQVDKGQKCTGNHGNWIVILISTYKCCVVYTTSDVVFVLCDVFGSFVTSFVMTKLILSCCSKI